MYVIGMGAAIITGEYDIAQIMLKAGLGIAGLLIIVFSTVTTTFLDAYSAGISSETVVSKWNGKHVAIVVTVIGTIAAIVYPMDNITDFLYLIGSVFAPMIAIQIADFFLLKRDKSSLAVHIPNLDHLGDWICGIPNSDEHRHAAGKHSAGYGDYDCNLSDRWKICFIKSE